MKTHWFSVRVLVLILVLLLAGAWGTVQAHLAATFLIDLPVPANSGNFGKSVTVLSNGNFVVTDPTYDSWKGAVYLYSPDRVLISRLAGDLIDDTVGSGGITVLANGNYVVSSPFWDSGSAYTQRSVGAVTWCSQWTGCNGVISAANSLIGGNNSDLVGFGGVIALANGNYVASSPHWNTEDATWAGAVTWGNGTVGTTGVVSISNSLVGSSSNDQVGTNYNAGIITLTNGNYLVLDPVWDNGSIVNAGAVTWGNGCGGTAGAVSAANSLVGSSANDSIGDNFYFGTVIELANGSYVVVSSAWDLDAAHQDVWAITWGSGTTGVSGPISTTNSLVGKSSTSHVGSNVLDHFGVTALSNGNYVVSSPYWSPDGTGAAWGAATWGSGTTGVSGFLSASNSLVGSRAQDSVGSGDFFGKGAVIALTNGNYVVNSSNWNDQGAITWGNGTIGITGPVSVSNSLVGVPHTLAGRGGVIALANGNYAVSTPSWSDGPHVGAITWGNGAIGTIGVVSTTNSLVGSSTFGTQGDGALLALTNGNYVVFNSSTANGVGAVTWVNGSHVTTGVITATNSLMGSTTDDQVGSYGGGVITLTNGNYVVISPYWDNGSITDAGAVTWGNGASGTIGVVSAANSLVGSTANDRVGSDEWDGGVITLTNGNYVVSIPQWDNGNSIDAGAVTWGDGMGSTVGTVSANNSLVGSATGDNIGNGSFWGVVGVTALVNGNYIVNSPHFSDTVNLGAVTWGNGMSGTVGAVSAANSLLNTCANDPTFCVSEVTDLRDGNASMLFQDWSNGSNNGAVSLIAGNPCGTFGPVSIVNSVLGTTAEKGFSMVSSYDAARGQLIVGRPYDNKVTILRCMAGSLHRVYLPLVVK